MADITRVLRENRQWENVLPVVESSRAQIAKELKSTPIKTARRRAMDYLERRVVPPTPPKYNGRGKRTRRRKTRRVK